MYAIDRNNAKKSLINLRRSILPLNNVIVVTTSFPMHQNSQIRNRNDAFACVGAIISRSLFFPTLYVVKSLNLGFLRGGLIIQPILELYEKVGKESVLQLQVDVGPLLVTFNRLFARLTSLLDVYPQNKHRGLSFVKLKISRRAAKTLSPCSTLQAKKVISRGPCISR